MADETLFKKIYSVIDKDGDGSISEVEVKLYFKALGLKINDEGVSACFKLYDIDGNGTIDMDEFVNVTKKTCTAILNNDEKAKDMFQKLFGNEGSVSSEKLSSMFKIHGYNPSEIEINHLLEQADTDGDGDVTFHEFIVKMAKVILSK